MADTSSLLGALTTTLTSKTGTSSKTSGTTLNNNFDMFMSLLTTQLKNQDPTNPMSATEFTQQLTQYSGIEQAIKTNSLLETLINQQTSGGSLSAIGFLGTTVTTKGNSASLQAGGSASWSVTSSGAGTALVKVSDADGKLVRSFDAGVNEGTQKITWDGKNDQGTPMASGSYTISVNGKNSAGTALTIGTGMTGTVSGIDFTGTEPTLTVGGEQIKLSQVAKVAVE